MFPGQGLIPDLTKLESRIAPLVEFITQMGIPTFWSCEGHGNNRSIIQTPFPMVGMCPSDSVECVTALICLMRMIGIHNSYCNSFDHVRWCIVPQSEKQVMLRPLDDSQSLEEYHKSLEELVLHLRNLANLSGLRMKL